MRLARDSAQTGGRVSYDSWKTNEPTHRTGGEANPDQAFWQGLRFARRHGTVGQYLDIYRGTSRFGGLVAQAEAQHQPDCDCQVCQEAV